MLSFVRWGKTAGIVSSMLSSALWRAYSNVLKVLAVGFSSCRSKSPPNTSGSLYILSFTSVVSVGRMNSYKWANELLGSFGLSIAFQIIESFSRPARPVVGGPLTGAQFPVSRTSSRRAVCRMEEINWERYASGTRSPISRTCKFGKVSRNWNMIRPSSSPIVIYSELSSSFLCQMMSKKHWHYSNIKTDRQTLWPLSHPSSPDECYVLWLICRPYIVDVQKWSVWPDFV